MLEQPVSMADARVAWDQHADRWLVRRGERAWLARRWSWGERRRLLAWAAPSGLLDAERFVAGLLDLLVTALPAAGHESDAAAANPGEERDWLASVTLELLGVRPGTTAASLGHAELVAARALGWGPLELDRQPLPAADELLAALLEPEASAAPAVSRPEPLDDTWTRIVVDDG